MTGNDNAIGVQTVTTGSAPADRRRFGPGLALGGLGVLAFSFSLPATRLAVADLDPWLVAFGRAVVAGVLAIVVLGVTRATRPDRLQRRRLAVIALGVVVGFPLGTSLALETLPAARGAIVVATLPAATAVAAVLRAGERPSRGFWAASAAGLLSVLGFVAVGGGGLGGGPQPADALLLAAVAACAVGYAEGGVLARDLGGTRTICWALVLALPLTSAVTAVSLIGGGVHPDADASAWLGFAYVSVVSMFLGFFAWYAGLARGGVARVGQVQLAQPLLTLGWAALLLGEPVTWRTLAVALMVLGCVVATQRARVSPAAGAPDRAGG